MSNIFKKIKLALGDASVRNKILFALFALLLFRFLAAVPIPGVDPFQLQAFLAQNQFFGLLNIFSGGGLSQLSIVMLGVGPYITAVIILQLLTVMSPRLKSLYQEEGDIGRQKFYQYGRVLTVFIAAVQGFGLMMLLRTQGVLLSLSSLQFVVGLLIVIAGSLLLMWIGELITEFGIGNGVSILIFAGIVAAIPGAVSQLIAAYTPDVLVTYIGLIFAAIIVIAGVVWVIEAERLVPITYAKQSRGGQTYGGVSTYLPLRINQAGVMPIIFALSIMLFPQMMSNWFIVSASPVLQSIGNGLLWFFSTTWLYAIVYFLLVFLFTFFYTAITFDPESTATNLQKSGAFVSGVRPGTATAEYLATIMQRITFLGAIFLGLVATIPVIIQQLTGIQALAIGGTGLLIAVAVVLDLMKKIDAQVSMREY
ncbi:MAG: preprotein translocase subunit SecY [Candidatus Pacebacteria bacterium]|nr:preprotein translocase subunit SecY [Candidatus Paceibacterota bacterium]